MRLVTARLGTTLALGAAIAGMVALAGRAPSAAPAVVAPAPTSIGPLTFAPDGTLFAADTSGRGD